MRGFMVLFLTLLVLIASASALEVETYDAVFNLVDDKAVVEVDISLNNQTGLLDIELPEDNTALSVYVDDEAYASEIQGNILQIDLDNASNIHFNYVTQEVIDKTNFLMNMQLGFDVKDMTIKLVLPQGAMLKKPIKKGKGSIFPKPTETDTDGRSLIFIWKQQDLKQDDEIAIFAQIEPKKEYSAWIAVIIVLMILVIGLFFTYRKKPKQKEGKTSDVEKHLKEDEEQIVTILKRKEGSCEQGTLRVITGFSKAHLSRLLKELEERKVIHKEKKGKKNIVFLK
jgi:uncharacterized membrane protein